MIPPALLSKIHPIGAAIFGWIIPGAVLVISFTLTLLLYRHYARKIK